METGNYEKNDHAFILCQRGIDAFNFQEMILNVIIIYNLFYTNLKVFGSFVDDRILVEHTYFY